MRHIERRILPAMYAHCDIATRPFLMALSAERHGAHTPEGVSRNGLLLSGCRAIRRVTAGIAGNPHCGIVLRCGKAGEGSGLGRKASGLYATATGVYEGQT